jgi:hypothetical protein
LDEDALALILDGGRLATATMSELQVTVMPETTFQAALQGLVESR